VRDAEDFVQFVHRCAHRLKKVAFLLTGSEHDAEDLLQTVLAKLYVRWRRIDANGDPMAYAHRVMVTTHVSVRRRRWWGERPTGDVPETDHEPDPAGRVEGALVLRAALRALTPRQRAVVVLRHYADLDERSVADMLGCSVGTVKTLNSRALARLRKQLEPDTEGAHGGHERYR
jgi:RNA polymerase sigma-70 factor (sigma-E family)